MENPQQRLQQYRDGIDQLDDAMANLLIKRMEIIREVAQLKAEHWPNACHIRPGREGEMHRRMAQRFANSPFPPALALALWRQLIGGSTQVESALDVAYLEQHSEHYFLAREYFGIQLKATASASVDDAISLVQSGKSNILLVPAAPSLWINDARRLHNAGMFLFATLPVAEELLPVGCTPALAFAGVQPENSGDDISYFLMPDDTLHTLDGFHTTHGNALFIGAHPRPLRLTPGVMHA